MNKPLSILAICCFLIVAIKNLISSYKWYKKYLIDIYEYNKGRGYLNVWQNDLHKCYSHLTWAVVFICLSYIIYFFI